MKIYIDRIKTILQETELTQEQYVTLVKRLPQFLSNFKEGIWVNLAGFGRIGFAFSKQEMVKDTRLKQREKYEGKASIVPPVFGIEAVAEPVQATKG